MIDLRLPTPPPTTSTTRLPGPLPLPSLPTPLRPAGRSVNAVPPRVASPVSAGHVYHAAAAAHALRPSRRQPVGALVHSVAGMRSNVLEPHRRAIGPQGAAARALLLRSTTAPCSCATPTHAPVVVQIAICESERMSTPPHLAALARVRPSVRGRPR